VTEDPAGRLYGLPLEAFTQERDAAARALRRAGDREAAAALAKLPKPTPAAWAANQVAREQTAVMSALLDAGAALSAAQEAAVSGGGGRALREATIAERRAVDAVMAAAEFLRPAGRPLSRAMADRLRTTLHAAAADESIRTALAAGRLVDEAQAVGAWPFALDPSPAAGTPGPPPRRERARRRRTASDDETTATDAGTEETAGEGTRPARRERVRPQREARPAAEAAEEAGRAAAAAAARERLEADLEAARSTLRVRERGLAGAERDAERAAQRAIRAQAAAQEAAERLFAARQAAEEAEADATAADRLATESRDALAGARDDVARLEERLD
jgi:hypothetical protein